MKLRIEIELDNAAFHADDDNPDAITAFGVSRLLRETAQAIGDDGELPDRLTMPRDINGNKVATYELIKD